MGLNKDIVKRQTDYIERYKEIKVTYYDDLTRTFTPYEWAIFEIGVRKISKKIEFIDL